MKKQIRILCLAMAVLMFSGCGGKAGAAVPQPLGTLTAIEYSRTVDMIWGENFSVRVSPGKIDSIEYFVEADSDYRFESGISLEDGQWQVLETAALELLPGLTEDKPKKLTVWERLIIKKGVILDGADDTILSFDWETPDGIVSVNYNWKHDDPKAEQLMELLYALQENRKGE